MSAPTDILDDPHARAFIERNRKKDMKIVIFDLDGCISDDRRRRHLLPDNYAARAIPLTPADWEPYHEGLKFDQAINATLVLEAMAKRYHIAFITARPEAYQGETLSWLEDKFGEIENFTLLMRPLGNDMASPDLKVTLFDYEKGFEWSNVVAAYDDREDVLLAYNKRTGGSAPLYLTTEAGAARLTNTFRPQDRAAQPAAKYIGQSISERERDALAAEGDWITPQEARALAALDDEDDAPPPINTEAANDVPTILERMASTFRERNKVYGSHYEMSAPLTKVLFPDGVPTELIFTDQWHLFELILVKLSRFAISELTHVDSIHDTAVYGAMIESILEKAK